MNKNLIKNNILENWILIDRILFGDKTPKSILKENYKKYLEDKCAFLVNLREIQNIIKYKNPSPIYTNIQELNDYITDKIEITTEIVHRFMEKDENINLIKQEVSNYLIENTEIQKNQATREVVEKYFKNNLFDYALLKESFQEISGDITKHWKFKLLFNTHKVMRENLVKYGT